jgi:G3E family GTPase
MQYPEKIENLFKEYEKTKRTEMTDELGLTKFDQMQVRYSESLNKFKKKMNEKPSIAELKKIKEDINRLKKESILKEDKMYTTEPIKSFYETLHKMQSQIFIFKLDRIYDNIDESISLMQLQMVFNRLLNESATHESIGDLYKLPFGCLMAIASS